MIAHKEIPQTRWRHLRPFHGREAALCAPAMPVLMVIGMWADRPVDGAIAAGAAFSVGFGAARELRGRRWWAMIAAMPGMAAAAFIGCLLGRDMPIFILVAAIASALCAATALKDEDAWWVILQVVIAYLVAGSYPGTIGAAVHRSLVVLMGGAVQIGIVMALARLFPAAAAPVIIPMSSPHETGLLRAHMLRAAICVAASLVLALRLDLTNIYWAAMTALIVLKPRLHETSMRGLARLTGTLAGCALATLFAHICRAAPSLLILGMTGAATASFALQKAHYASLTAAITATVVLLLTLGHSSALANAEHRVVATLLGGMIALCIAWVIPHKATAPGAQADRVGLSERL